MHLENGTLLQGGTYRIVRFIKSGGFGCTYEAVHQLLNKRVAIKEFFVKDFCNREETGRITVGTLSKVSLVDRLKQKFIAEASSLSALSHDGIVNVSNLFLENDTAYYVMDYIDGCSLDVYVQQNGPLAETTALDYIGQACEALKYVHDKNILHLDVKPGNLMLDKDGKVTLIDFGTSKQYDECDGENTSTLLGNTPGYASPEQGNSKVTSFTPATDVYSLGATLYKLLTGITPPTASERSSGEELDPLPENISRSTADAIMKAMILNKKERLQSVGEFQSMLVSEVDRVVPPAVEDAAVVGSCPEDDDECTVYTGGDAGAPVVVVELGQQAAEPSFGPVPKKKSRRWLWWLLAAVILAGAGVFALVSDRRNNVHEGHEWVDLGLSVKWATCNVGASTPGDYGDYFAWGETSTKSSYTRDNSASIGKSWGDICGDSNRDAATANWGGSWRMPTKAEFQELVDKCTWTWTNQNGKNGYKVTGPNGNSIFLPASGYRYGGTLYLDGEYGRYWSSSPDESSTDRAYNLYFGGGYRGVDWGGRGYGRSVRPVLED